MLIIPNILFIQVFDTYQILHYGIYKIQTRFFRQGPCIGGFGALAVYPRDVKRPLCSGVPYLKQESLVAYWSRGQGLEGVTARKGSDNSVAIPDLFQLGEKVPGALIGSSLIYPTVPFQ